MLDYSLRDGGWLDEYFLKDGTEILIAEDNQEMVGFSILSQVPGDLAEFRIALHPYKLGRGIGKTLAFLTIRHGFRDPALHAIYLIVRKNNPRAQRLYESLHIPDAGRMHGNRPGRTGGIQPDGDRPGDI